MIVFAERMTSEYNFDCLRADVERHHAVGNRVDVLGFAAAFEFRRDRVIHRQHQLVAHLIHKLLRQINLVFFHQRFACGLAFGLEEGVCHRAADQQPVDDLRQVLDHFDLVRHLGAAQNRDARPLGMACRLAEPLEFLIHQQSGSSFRHELDHPYGRGMRAVRRAERIVHIEITQCGELLRELGIVLFFLSVKAQILEQHDLDPASDASLPLRDRRNRAPSLTGLPSNSWRRFATGFKLISGFGLPFGRPRWLARITPAPFSSAY